MVSVSSLEYFYLLSQSHVTHEELLLENVLNSVKVVVFVASKTLIVESSQYYVQIEDT